MPLTVGDIRKAIEGLPDGALVETEKRWERHEKGTISGDVLAAGARAAFYAEGDERLYLVLSIIPLDEVREATKARLVKQGA